MTPTQSKILKKLLPPGYISRTQELLEQAGLRRSASQISRAANGKDVDPELDEVLYQLAARERERRASLDQRLKELAA